ncbi:MAG: hypothetical protein AAGI53_13065 [Planctomycetota bacterium]
MPGGSTQSINDSPDDRPADVLDRFVDGTASPEERDRVEADPGLRAQAAKWREIEDAIVRTEPATVAPNLDELTPAPLPFLQRPVFRYLAVAAALVVATGAVVTFLPPVGQAPLVASNGRDAGRYYRMMTRSFEPSVVCDTPEKFADYTNDVFGVAMTASFETPVALIGWTALQGGYDEGADVEGPRVLLARAPSGDEVIVIFEAEEAAPIEAAEGLHTFTRTFGAVTATEITPADASHVLDVISML